MSDYELEQLLAQRAPDLRDLWLSNLPGPDELPEYITSPRFRRRMDRLMRHQRWPAILRQVRQAVVAAVLLIVFTFSGLFVTSEAFRNDVISVLTRAFRVITEFHYSADFETEQTPGDFTLTYLPHGMEETERLQGSKMCQVRFEDDSGHFVRLRHAVVSPTTAYFQGLDTEDAEIEYFDIHGAEGMCIYKKGVCTITWINRNSVYTLSSTLSVEETQKIALGLR